MLHSDYSIASAIESSDSTSLVGTTLGQGRHGGCAVGYTTAMRVTMGKATRLKSERALAGEESTPSTIRSRRLWFCGNDVRVTRLIFVLSLNSP